MRSENRARMEELEKEGWIKRFVASEPRLSEAVDLYKEAGFEVLLEPLPKGRECNTCGDAENTQSGQCRVCFDDFEDQFKIIFTRPARDEKTRDHDFH